MPYNSIRILSVRTLSEFRKTSETPYQTLPAPYTTTQEHSKIRAAFTGTENFGRSSGLEVGASLGDRSVERFGQGRPEAELRPRDQVKAYIYIYYYIHKQIYIYMYMYIGIENGYNMHIYNICR